jgi:hypothetical protein
LDKRSTVALAIREAAALYPFGMLRVFS